MLKKKCNITEVLSDYDDEVATVYGEFLNKGVDLFNSVCDKPGQIRSDVTCEELLYVKDFLKNILGVTEDHGDITNDHIRKVLDGLSESLADVSARAIVRPPGHCLNKIAEFIYTKRVYERVFQPALVDLEDEYFEALSEERLWKARWVHLRGVGSLCTAALVHIPVSITRLVTRLWTMAS